MPRNAVPPGRTCGLAPRTDPRPTTTRPANRARPPLRVSPAEIAAAEAAAVQLTSHQTQPQQLAAEQITS